MSKYEELIGQLVEYRAASFDVETKKMEPKPVALGLIAEIFNSDYIRIEWLVNPHDYTLFNAKEINKFGLTLKDNEEWGM